MVAKTKQIKKITTMKKIFIAALVLAAASCAKNEVVNLNQEAIDFGNPFVENSTRAAADPSFGKDANAITEFNVWGTANGVAIYTGQSVEDTDSDGLWECGTKNYWVNGVTYNFAAVVNGNVTSLSNGLPATISYTANGTSDLVYADKLGMVGQPAGSNVPVDLTFAHLLSKVKFTVETEMTAADYRYEVTGINITSAPASGVYTVATKTWAPDAATDGQAFDSITVNATNKKVECANEKLIIPTSTVSVAYKVALQIKNGQNWDTIWEDDKTSNPVTLNGVELAAGNAYNFTLTLNIGEEIKFSVDEDVKWTSNDPVTIQ